MANLNKMTRDELKNELGKLGEVPPAAWTRLEMKARVMELRGDEGTSLRSPLQEKTRELRKAAKKKADLIEFCRELGVELNGNETMAVMEMRAIRKLQAECPASPYDHVGFGKHSDKRYQTIQMEYEEYGRWVVQMFREDPEGKDTDPRLRRLAKWLIEQSAMTNEPMVKASTARKPDRKSNFGPKPRTMPPSSITSAPTASSSEGPTEAMVQEQNRRLDQMADVIEMLRSELTAARGEPPRKGAEKKNDDAVMTDGSYSMVSSNTTPEK
eukprot:s4022_g2.t1